MAAASVGKEIIELSTFNTVDDLTCSICLDLFTVPKKLPCGHIFCEDCLFEHAAVQVPFLCPLCRSTIKIPLKGIPDLPNGRLDLDVCDRIKEFQKPEEEKWIECRSFGGTGSQRGKFRGPRGLAVSDRGEIFVADYRNKRIQVFDFQGTFLSYFYTVLPEEELYPYGLTLDSGGNIWVVGRASGKPTPASMSSSLAMLGYCGMTTYSSQYERELSSSSTSRDFAALYTRQGRYLIHFDIQKTKWAARGVAMDTKENNVIVTKVAENGNSVIQVFKQNGTLLRTVGDEQGMEYPHYVTVDKEGRVLVSDSAGPYVYVYDQEGEFLFKFGGWGEGEGQLNRPHGICTDSLGRIFVADSGNDRVDMFDSSGEFLSHAISDIKQPLAVATTRRGNLIVSNSEM
ncbi:tripartite motif-containing protein 3-like [Branchiostoma floridae]|uniref:RING-type E3 ubiquitin transferase n=1 Tax=Branchiostoma floridae TaxID=7739 RepID=A0A9J7HQ02_BRAFL|nr:tripartite motif-containing protein 3-like [Branchiostoma floridae]